jgi:hypothetical protein
MERELDWGYLPNTIITRRDSHPGYKTPLQVCTRGLEIREWDTSSHGQALEFIEWGMHAARTLARIRDALDEVISDEMTIEAIRNAME